MNSKEVTELVIVGVIALVAFQYLSNQAAASAANAAAAASSSGSGSGIDLGSLISGAASFAGDFS